MITLYDISVENFNRVLDSTINIMKKCQKHFEIDGQDLEEIVNMKLAPDMLPFSFQVNSVRHHSLHAIEGLVAGEFRPPEPLPETDFAGLIQLLEVARTELQAFGPETVNPLEGKPLYFRMGSMELPFTTENFIMSFSLPNLYFHAATTYDMLRIKGGPLGKVDFMGQMKIGLPG